MEELNLPSVVKLQAIISDASFDSARYDHTKAFPVSSCGTYAFVSSKAACLTLSSVEAGISILSSENVCSKPAACWNECLHCLRQPSHPRFRLLGPSQSYVVIAEFAGIRFLFSGGGNPARRPSSNPVRLKVIPRLNVNINVAFYSL